MNTAIVLIIISKYTSLHFTLNVHSTQLAVNATEPVIST